MQIGSQATDQATLLALGEEAVSLLCTGQLEALAARFGYALAFDREKAAAIRDDLKSMNGIGSTGPGEATKASHKIKYFEPNQSGLVALVESCVPANNGKALLVELVVTSNGTETHVTLEQLSAV